MSKITNCHHFTITMAATSMLGFDWLDSAKNNNKSVLLTAVNALLQCAIHTNPLYTTQ